MNHIPKIAILGGGSWATALVKILSNSIKNVDGNDGVSANGSPRLEWWMRNKEVIDFIKKYKHNPHYLSSVELDLNSINVSNKLTDVLKNADMVIMAVPAAFLDNAMTENGIKTSHLENKIIVSAIKGIIPGGNQILVEYFEQKFKVTQDLFMVINGPCHAEEVALERLSYLTISCKNKKNAKLLADMMDCRYINTKVSNDIYGTEYSAVLKNIIAIASGICRGSGFGDNYQAVLISNAIQEINRFIGTVHPIDRDIKDSAYLGDLLVTAYSQFSRNRTLGNMIGKGYSVKSAMIEMGMVSEGYYASKCINEINKKYKVDMPICDAVYNVLYEKISPRVEMRLLADKLN